MSLNEIIRSMPEWVPWSITGLLIAGMAVHAGIGIYRGEKRLNSRFKELQANYRDDFSKEELIKFYAELVKKVRPYLWGKKRKAADEMTVGLEKQIMAYATEEVKQAIDGGVTLGFRDSIEPHSPTYSAAINVFRDAARAAQQR